MSRLHELSRLGQSIWFDNIRRALLTSGELEELLDAGVMGVTSNPSIFEKAIAGSTDYDASIRLLQTRGLSAPAIAEALAVEDIQRAADLLRPIFDRTEGVDGYVSLEVDPTLAHDTEGTVAAALRLRETVGRRNVMIKVPGTSAGIEAIETLTGRGVSINVTLIFDQATYEAVAAAWLRGLTTFVTGGGDPATVASVASFFISRIDTAVDAELAERNVLDLQGTIAVASAKLAYRHYQQLIASPEWTALAAKGARPQRLLWASTSAKNPAYADTKYVDELIGADTVNTVPPATLTAVLDHGTAALTLTEGVAEAEAAVTQLATLGIDYGAITRQLQVDAVAGFTDSFEALNASLVTKLRRLASTHARATFSLGQYGAPVEAAVHDLRNRQIMKRIWRHDYTVWRSTPTEIVNRLGWLHAAEAMMSQLGPIHALVRDAWDAGYRQAVLFGMGGSSMAAEVFEKTFGPLADPAAPRLPLTIIDTTDPDAMRERTQGLDLATTLVIVATKSGNTVETLSGFKYLHEKMVAAVGATAVGSHFVAITDPGSALAALATTHRFRATFLNDPNIGGRYAALSCFGLVPAALAGADVSRLLHNALTVSCNAESANCPAEGDNLAARLGVTLGELAKAGRDKLTFVISPAVASFGDWVEQLIAESTGKDGRGIVPIVGERLGPPNVYGKDRVFVHLAMRNDLTSTAALDLLREVGHPVITIRVEDAYDLGGQFFLWEMATAVAASRLDIHPFDQPDVEAAKDLARSMVSAYFLTGSLPSGTTVAPSADALNRFVQQAGPGGYIAIQAYINPTDETDQALGQLRQQLRDATGLATTLGYGPRYLHSTGQLHKGDGGHGLFIQLLSQAAVDLPIPDDAASNSSTMTFGILKAAQALGDAQALEAVGRKVLRFDLGTEPMAGLAAISQQEK